MDASLATTHILAIMPIGTRRGDPFYIILPLFIVGAGAVGWAKINLNKHRSPPIFWSKIARLSGLGKRV